MSSLPSRADQPRASRARTAIVVPGHGSAGADRAHRITERCREIVTEAGRLAVALEPEVVVLTGWSSSGGPSEAEQMKDAWSGPAVELLVEPTARSTAENASRSLSILVEHGIRAAVVVCAPVHLLRARLLFGRLYRERGVAVRFHLAFVRPSLRAAAWELAALPLVPAQLRSARAELDRRRV
jgi:uncharacterized SAM-binding protein YcdF (DUF218 family)